MMEPSFEKLLVRLTDADVRFIVVGGVAVILNGYVRLTEDIDLLLDSDPENITRLLDTLAGFGEGFARELTPADFSEEEGAIRIIEESEDCMIDLFTLMSGLKFADLISDAETQEVGGRRIHHASKAALIRLKSHSVREKDRLDVLALEQLRKNPKAFD